MLDDSGTFAGGAAKEIEEETGLQVQQSELLDMTSLASELTKGSSDNGPAGSWGEDHVEGRSAGGFVEGGFARWEDVGCVGALQRA